MNPLLRALLIGLRANCEATICAIDLFLEMSSPGPVTGEVPNDASQAETPAPAQSSPSSETGEPAVCQHPNLIHAPVMGNPGRFICQNQQCKAEVNK